MTQRKRGTWFSGTATRMLVGAAIAAWAGSDARAAETPETAKVLNELHETNQKEIAAGKVAEKSGKTREVKDYGKTLQKDHTAADKKVTALAKQEKIELAAPPEPAAGMSGMASDPMFDAKFAQEMLDGHKKAIADVTEAHDHTSDEKLKKLLGELLPTLKKHEEIAQKILDKEGKKEAASR